MNEIKEIRKLDSETSTLLANYLSIINNGKTSFSVDKLNELLKNSFKGVALYENHTLQALAIGTTFDVSFMINTTGLVLRIPILIGEPDYYDKAIKELLEITKKLSKVSSLMIDVFEGEDKKVTFLKKNGFERFCAWYKKPVIHEDLNKEIIIRQLEEKDAVKIAELTYQTRLKRQEKSPILWNLKSNSKDSHIPYIKSLISNSENICLGIDLDNELSVFAIAMPTKQSLPFYLNINAEDSLKVIIDDCQAVNDDIRVRYLPIVISQINNILKSKNKDTELVYICCVFDESTEAFLKNTDWQINFEWYGIAID